MWHYFILISDEFASDSQIVMRYFKYKQCTEKKSMICGIHVPANVSYPLFFFTNGLPVTVDAML